MKVIKCELCGSTEVTKIDGLYQCNHCKTKYTAQEAAKLLQDVKIDRSNELENYIVLARRAKEEDNAKNAEKYYELALHIDPSNWEAIFYHTYFSAINTSLAGIEGSIQKVINSTSSALKTIGKESNTEEVAKVLSEITDSIRMLSLFYYSVLKEHYLEFKHLDSSGEEFVDVGISVYSLDVSIGLLIEQHIENEALKTAYAPVLFESGIEILKETFITRWNGLPPSKILELYNGQVNETAFKIRKYKPDYTPPRIAGRTQGSSNPSGVSKKEGCYIATAVYGDYSHPKVQVLRGFRDAILQNSKLGRLFIKCYYKISPVMVRTLGSYTCFIKASKYLLDKFVSYLNSNSNIAER